MKVTFKSSLDARRTASGWELLGVLAATIDERDVYVPAGFVTDFASVPRLPFAFWLFGDSAHRAGVLHDWLYSQGEPRRWCDAVFLAAMQAEGLLAWRRYPMWLAVRLFGARAWGRR